IKQVDNGDGGTKAPSDWTMNVTASNPSDASFAGTSAGKTITIDPGAFSVGETAGAGVAAGTYTLKSQVGCSGTALVGQHYTCTVTNTRKTGTIRVVKDLIPSADPGRFDLRVDGNVVRADAGDGDGSGAVTVNTGTHTVSEVAGSVGDVNDYASSIACTPGGA